MSFWISTSLSTSPILWLCLFRPSSTSWTQQLKPRSHLCCFLGYGETQKGYRCYDPIAHRLHISRHVVFWEHRLFTEVSQFRPSFSLSFVLDILPEASTTSPEMPTSVQLSEPPSHSSGSFSDELPHSSYGSHVHAPSEDLVPTTTLLCSFWVTFLPSHLRDFHCYKALATCTSLTLIIRPPLTIYGKLQ